MKISPCNINFKGYDAAPLKNIYLEEGYCGPFKSEMQNACEMKTLV